MTNQFGLFSFFSKLGKNRLARSAGVLQRLLRDEDGSYLLFVTLAIPVLIGVAGLATEGALIFYNNRSLQSAADAAAYSAAIAYSIDTNADITTEAQAIVANYGFVVNTDPSNPANNQVSLAPTPSPQVIGNYEGTGLTAIQVNVTRSQLPLFSIIWANAGFSLSRTATAIISGGAGGGNVRLSVTSYADALRG